MRSQGVKAKRRVARFVAVAFVATLFSVAHAVQIFGRAIRFGRPAAGLTVFFDGYRGVTDQNGVFFVDVPGFGCYNVQIYSGDQLLFRAQWCVSSTNLGDVAVP